MIWMIRHNPPAARRVTLSLCNSRNMLRHTENHHRAPFCRHCCTHARARVMSAWRASSTLKVWGNARARAHETRQINWLFIFYQIILFVVGLSTERESEGKLHMENCILSANDRDIVELARSSLPSVQFFSSSSNNHSLLVRLYFGGEVEERQRRAKKKRGEFHAKISWSKSRRWIFTTSFSNAQFGYVWNRAIVKKKKKITRNEIHTFEALLSLFALSARATRRDLDSANRFRREKYVFVTTRGFVQIKYLPNVYTHRNDDDGDLR